MLGSHRLVTLCGVGGVGKSRLALRVCHDVRRAFRDGVFLVELGSLSDPELLAHTALDAVPAKERAVQAPVRALVSYLAGRHVLLVLDNCEHLTAAVADLATCLLRAAPELRILATSRQVLAIEGEQVYPVPTLPVLSPAASRTLPDALACPSVALFADRAAAAVPGFELTAENREDVVRVCERLDGIPLAIELAAARLRVLSPRELAQRVDRRFDLLARKSRTFPEHHQTLRATIDYSYALCTETEQLLWARAAVFQGGFTLDAAESVCSDELLPHEAVIDTMSALAEKSILLREESAGVVRFAMLETIREYGLLRLHEAGSTQRFRRRHRDWCAGLVNLACAEWFGPSQRTWAAELRREHANLRAALEFCASTPGEGAAGLWLAGRPWFLWLMGGLAAEGDLWLRRMLQTSSAPTRERAWALATAAALTALRGDAAAAEAQLAESRRIGSYLDDPDVIAYATHHSGLLGFVSGDLADTITWFLRARELYQRAGLTGDFVALLDVELAIAYALAGDVSNADQVVTALYRRCEDAGDDSLRSSALYARGLIGLIRGRLDAAESDLMCALQVKRDYRDTPGIALALDFLGWVRIASGRSLEGAVLLGAGSHLWEGLGSQLLASEHMAGHRDHFRTAAARDLGADAARDAWARGDAMSLEEALAHALGERGGPPQDKNRPGAPSVLTPRESEVAGLAAGGMTNKQIAAALVISPRTVDVHIEHILAKLGLTSRGQLPARLTARESGSDAGGPGAGAPT